jgi:hypothetical protein
MTALSVCGVYVLSLLTGFVLARLFLKTEKNGWFLLFISPAAGFGVTAFITFFSFHHKVASEHSSDMKGEKSYENTRYRN